MMSAGSTFASQQKALRRQFSYSDDYPLATMIKELNTGCCSSRRLPPPPTQPRRRRRTRREERARTAESRVRFLGCRWAKASFLTRKLGTGGPHFLTLRFLNARCQLYEEVLTVLAIARAQPRPARGPAERALEPPEPPHRVIDYSS